jgi:hypothetical protein
MNHEPLSPLTQNNGAQPVGVYCQDPMHGTHMGLAELPARQTPDVHQPQPSRAVQVEHVVALQQEATGH